MVRKPGLFDLDERRRKLSELGDPLVRLVKQHRMGGLAQFSCAPFVGIGIRPGIQGFAEADAAQSDGSSAIFLAS